MITNGFWCDECRQKYVRHMCRVKPGNDASVEDSHILRQQLPCGHDWSHAVAVECQAFARSGEHVWIHYGLRGSEFHEDVWISRGERPRSNFIGRDAFEFWGMRVRQFQYKHEADWELWVGEWLASKPDAFVRAYLNRWESSNRVPSWSSFREHPDAKRACALAVPEK
jgi:hypothetical protein